MAVTLTQILTNKSKALPVSKEKYYPISLFKYDYTVHREKIYFRYLNTFNFFFLIITPFLIVTQFQQI